MRDFALSCLRSKVECLLASNKGKVAPPSSWVELWHSRSGAIGNLQDQPQPYRPQGPAR